MDRHRRDLFVSADRSSVAPLTGTAMLSDIGREQGPGEDHGDQDQDQDHARAKTRGRDHGIA